MCVQPEARERGGDSRRNGTDLECGGQACCAAHFVIRSDFLHNSSLRGWGGSFLVRVAPAELEMFFLAGTANGII